MTTNNELRRRRKYFLSGLITGSLLGGAATILGGMILRREVAKILNERLRNGLESSPVKIDPEDAEAPDNSGAH